MKSSEIKLNKNNPRIIKNAKFKALVKSLKDFPEMSKARPIVINQDNMILGGNMRYKAMIEAGWTDIPIKKVNWSEKKQKEFIIKDNLAYGEWDYDVLANDYDLKELEECGMEMDSFNLENEIIEDEAPAVEQGEPISKLGEIYQLGRHKLMCGDSTKIEDVEKLMGGKKADLVFTDPPYGIDVVTGGKVGADFGVAKKGEYSDVIGDDTIETARDFYNTFVSLGMDRFIIWGGNYFTSFLPQSDGWLIWDKRGDSGIRNTFADGEMAWCSFHTPVRIYKQLWNGMIREGESEKRVHPTQKPIQTLSSIIKDFTKENEIVVDVFGGSGSTLIACEQTDRTCYMMELDKKYADVIRKRYYKFVTGNEEGWEKGTPAISG